MKLMKTRDKELKRPQVRPGRPPKDMAGDVTARILDAAQRVFIQRGYQGASLDEIAQVAPASKPTIYATSTEKRRCSRRLWPESSTD